MPARKQAVRNPETWESAVSWKPREPRVHRGERWLPVQSGAAGWSGSERGPGPPILGGPALLTFSRAILANCKGIGG